MVQISVHLVTILCNLGANSFVEWYVHMLMHRKEGNKYLTDEHKVHHNDYPKHNPQNSEHGLTVHLPWWVGVLSVGSMSSVALIPSYLTKDWSIIWSVAITNALYFLAYNYGHTCLHVPSDRWIKKTRWYKFMFDYHKIHHSQKQEWGRMANICVLCPLADWVMGTWYWPKKEFEN